MLQIKILLFFTAVSRNFTQIWASENSDGEESAVLKTRVRLGKCLDLSDSSIAPIIRVAYDHLKEEFELKGQALPKNDPNDTKNHPLDCAVMNYLPKIVEIDTIRAPFYEGKSLYPGSFLLSLSHIQIVVINENNIVEKISLF